MSRQNTQARQADKAARTREDRLKAALKANMATAQGAGHGARAMDAAEKNRVRQADGFDRGDRRNGRCNGQIPIAGAKNACLTLMPATLLSEEPLTLTNAPRLSDITTMTQLLQSLGAEVTSLQDGQVLAMSSHDLTNRHGRL